MAGVGDAAAPREGGADGAERDGRAEAEQLGGGGHGPPPAPQHTETLGFYESDRRRERRRSRAELSLFRFLSAELTRGYFLEHNEAKYTERRERVYTCMRIPRELEKLMVFGIFLCLDAFLYVFTLLPVRVFLALFRLFTLPCYGLSQADTRGQPVTLLQDAVQFSWAEGSCRFCSLDPLKNYILCRHLYICIYREAQLKWYNRTSAFLSTP